MNLKQAIKIANKILVQNEPLQLPAVIIDGECICGDPTSQYVMNITFGQIVGESQEEIPRKVNMQPLVLYPEGATLSK